MVCSHSSRVWVLLAATSGGWQPWQTFRTAALPGPSGSLSCAVAIAAAVSIAKHRVAGKRIPLLSPKRRGPRFILKRINQHHLTSYASREHCGTITAMSNRDLILQALSEGDGAVRLAPCWVPRSFLMPGGRLKLDPRDLYALGAHRGGIDERWFSSTTKAANGPLTAQDEGLSYIDFQGKRVLLLEAIETAGDQFLGADVMQQYGGWNLLCKFFDNLGPIPHHLHQTDEFAARVGQKGKPEAYYFPPQYNFKDNNFPYTFMGLNPGTTRDDLRRCLERWNEGDNGILYHSRAYKLKPGTGWQVDPGILHAPGSLVTYEPQVNSDVFAMFQ